MNKKRVKETRKPFQIAPHQWRIRGEPERARGDGALGGKTFKAVTVDKDPRCARLMFAMQLETEGRHRLGPVDLLPLLFFFVCRQRDVKTLMLRGTIFHSQQEINWRRRSGAFRVSGVNLRGYGAVTFSV